MKDPRRQEIGRKAMAKRWAGKTPEERRAATARARAARIRQMEEQEGGVSAAMSDASKRRWGQ